MHTTTDIESGFQLARNIHEPKGASAGCHCHHNFGRCAQCRINKPNDSSGSAQGPLSIGFLVTELSVPVQRRFGSKPAIGIGFYRTRLDVGLGRCVHVRSMVFRGKRRGPRQDLVGKRGAITPHRVCHSSLDTRILSMNTGGRKRQTKEQSYDNSRFHDSLLGRSRWNIGRQTNRLDGLDACWLVGHRWKGGC
jgi:hypothetical protein